MLLSTLRFGEIEIDEDKIVTFPQGIPGFEELRRYIFLQPDENIPFSFMQSIEDGNLALIVTNPFLFYSDYEFQLLDTVQGELEVQSDDDVMIWSVVSIKHSLNDATLNLQAPIIVNRNANTGKQVILHDSQYMTRHKLMPISKGDEKC